MNKKFNHPYLFLTIAILLLLKAISSFTHLFGFHLGSIFNGYIVSQSTAYEVGRFLGGFTSIVLLAGLSIYFFNKFKSLTQNPSV